MTKGKSHVTLRRLHFPETIVAEIPFKQQAMEYVPKMLAPGDTSDGWHSLDDLYRHRTILFASLCNFRQAHDPDGFNAAFKSWKHSDGTIEFDVSRADAHDFDDAVREWAKYWKVFSAAHKAKLKDKELNNAED